MALFSGQNITCVRGDRVVFRDLGFALDCGDMLVLTGHNGSGKSSLLRLMAGLLPVASGAVLWDGAAIGDVPERHNARLHYLGHADAIKTALNVTENLVFWASLHGNENSERVHERVVMALSSLGLDALAHTPVRLLSAGQRRRTALARLLASPARLWLLDEPTAALDRDAVTALESLITRHRETGGMVVVSTHTPVLSEGAFILDLARFAHNAGMAA